MFCNDGANVGSWKMVIEKVVEHSHCVWISGCPNYLNVIVAKSIDFERARVPPWSTRMVTVTLWNSTTRLVKKRLDSMWYTLPFQLQENLS